jgi:hypothetical protein
VVLVTGGKDGLGGDEVSDVNGQKNEGLKDKFVVYEGGILDAKKGYYRA